MQTFEQFWEQKQVLPPVLKIKIQGIGEFEAKADTGNDGYNVLHATNIQNNGSTVSFVSNNTQHQAQTDGNLTVNKGPKLKENRSVIKLNVSISGKTYQNIPFTISDRTGMSEPVLLSKDFLAQIGGVIDPSLE